MKTTIKIISLGLLIIFLSCKNIQTTEKIVYYRIDTNYFNLHTDEQPEVNFITLDNIYHDLVKKGKELNIEQRDKFNSLLNSSFNHNERDCGTIWKDGIFILYNSQDKIEKYVVVSLDCYQLIIHDKNDNLDYIGLNENGQDILFELIK